MKEIKDINGNIIFECDSENLKACIHEALKSRANLSGAKLRWANLR